MKSSREAIESGQYFCNSAGGAKVSQKLVKGNYPHTCLLCDGEIKKDELSLSLKCAFGKDGWKSGWICIPCCKNWLEKTHQI